MNDPLVSVIIPCFNQAEYLQECLRSLTAQTYSKWDAVVVDDASSAGNVCGIAETIGDDRIRCLRHPTNRGLAAARNSGMRNSGGNLLLPLDADDKLDRRFLEKTVRALVRHPDAALAFPDFAVFGETEYTLKFEVKSVAELLAAQWIPGPGALIRRSVWEQVGGYCEADELRAGNEDWDFLLSVAEHGLEVVHIAEPLYFYRYHARSMSRRLLYFDYITRRFIYARHRELFDSYRMKRTFLGEGYRRSAQAAWLRGERTRAIRLVGRYAWIAPISASASFLRIVRGAMERKPHE